MGNRGSRGKGHVSPRQVCPKCGRDTAVGTIHTLGNTEWVFLRRHKAPGSGMWCGTRSVPRDQ